METVTLQEAQANLEELVKKALAGKEIIIEQPDKTSVKLLAGEKKSTQKIRGGLGSLKGSVWMAEDFDECNPFQEERKPGALKGAIHMSDDFYDSDKEIEEMFYGKE